MNGAAVLDRMTVAISVDMCITSTSMKANQMMIRPDGLTATSSDVRYVCAVPKSDAGLLIRGLLAFVVALI
jgi:hypothetical protein